MADVSISLSPELVSYLDARVSSGRNTSVSDVIGEALGLLKQADAAGIEARARLRLAWEEGLSSGDAGEIDLAALKAEARLKLKRAG